MSSSEIGRRGLLLVLSSPSGAGKTTITRLLVERDANLSVSVSATTRPPRANEEEGKHYHFVSDARFDQMVRDGALLEHATVFGNRYGTPRAPVEAALAHGRDVLFDIDWQGTQQLRDPAKKVKGDLVTVFILPPSTRDLERRLITRAQDSKEVVAERMAEAAKEMSHYAEYDYVVVNRDIGTSLSNLKAILTSERLRLGRQVGLAAFVKALREGR
jgi:guanylate kinase